MVVKWSIEAISLDSQTLRNKMRLPPLVKQNWYQRLDLFRSQDNTDPNGILYEYSVRFILRNTRLLFYLTISLSLFPISVHISLLNPRQQNCTMYSSVRGKKLPHRIKNGSFFNTSMAVFGCVVFHTNSYTPSCDK